MDESRRQKMYREEAAVLGKIGQVFLGAEMPQIEVRLPGEVAEAAVAARERDDDESAATDQRDVRAACGHVTRRVTVIDRACDKRARAMDGDEVVAALDAVFIAECGRSSRRPPDLTAAPLTGQAPSAWQRATPPSAASSRYGLGYRRADVSRCRPSAWRSIAR